MFNKLQKLENNNVLESDRMMPKYCKSANKLNLKVNKSKDKNDNINICEDTFNN